MDMHSIGRPVTTLALAGTLAAPLVLPAAAPADEGVQPAVEVSAEGNATQGVEGTVEDGSMTEDGSNGPGEAPSEDGQNPAADSADFSGPLSEEEAPGQVSQEQGATSSSDVPEIVEPSADGTATAGGPSEIELTDDGNASAVDGSEAEGVDGAIPQSPVQEGPAGEVDETVPAVSALSAREALSFVYASQSEVAYGDVQEIAAILADGSKSVSSATLVLVDGAGSESRCAAANIVGSAMLFRVDTASLAAGWVELVELDVTYADGSSAAVDMRGDESMDYGFTVSGAAVSTMSLNGGESASLSVYSLDAEGNLIEASDFSEALSTASSGAPSSRSSRSANSEIVVALDPGHDSSRHPGAGGNGLKEEDLTLKIAQYCKEELETYSGVRVYMTRSTGDCPYPDAASEGEELRRRVEGAVSAGASIYVSIHLNSYDASNVSGAEVWYPNESYNALISGWGESLSQEILDQLTALGLNDRGTKENATLENGVDDYYSVIRTSKENGIPGIIVEHAFISSSADYGLLSSDAGLKSLGVADATGIASYLGLSKDVGSSASHTVVTGLVSIENVNATAGTFDIVATNVSCSSGIEGVSVGISGPNGASCWYALTQRADGAWVTTVDTADFGNASGRYWIEGSVTDSGWNGNAFCSTSQEVAIDVSAYATSAALSQGGSSVTFTASGGGLASSWQVSFQVSGSKGTFWRVGERAEDGSWSLTVPCSELGPGTATATPVAAYASSSDWLPSATASVPSASASLTASVSYDASAGAVVVSAEGVSCTTGVVGVSAGITAPDGTCRWYALERQGDGSWRAEAPLGDFGWQSGTYRAEMSVTDASWSGVSAGSASGKVEIDPDETSVSFDEDAASFAFSANGGQTVAESCWNLSFAVWPEDSDFKHASWCQAERLEDGSWTYDLRLVSLTEGTYSVQAWGSFDEGARMLSSATFEVDLHPIMGDSGVTSANLADAYGASGATYPSEVYADKGAPTIEDFCTIIVEEAKAEGVDPAVVFAQAMYETGYLSFGGDVDAGQCNFCGLGTTGAGEAGYSFESVREGIRAQVQHLKAYASTDELANECVDPRFDHVVRGMAPYVENLSTRWTGSTTYGYSIAQMVDALL